MDVLFSPLADALGASIDSVKLICCLLIAYPLGSLFVRIPSSQPNLKHAFNILVSIFFMIPVFHLHWGCLQLLGSVLATYFLVANTRGPNMPWVVFIFVMGHLAVNHVIRMVYETSHDTMNITIPQMFLTLKMIAFAWNVYDGKRPKEDLDEWQLQKRITNYPTLLEFLGYSFYFPGLLVGPHLEYASYASLIDGSSFKLAESARKMRRAIPDGRKRVAYRKMLIGLVLLGLHVTMSPIYHFSNTLTPWFAEYSILYRIIVFQSFGFFMRCKYYAIWTLTEGASILTGFGFTGFGPSGQSLWEGAANIKLFEVELPSNSKVLLDSWNINTSIWLRECVYKRVTPKGKKPCFRSILITSATGAFWHGFEVGYYLAFILGSFITYVGRSCRADFRPLVLHTTWTKRIYDLFGTVISIMLLNFATAPLTLLSITDSIEAWARLGWYGCWIVGCTLVFFSFGGSEYLQRLQKKQGRALESDVKQRQTPPPSAVAPLRRPVLEELKMRIN